MNDQVAAYIEQLDFRPGSPEWRGMSEAERLLAAFNAFMHDHACDGLVNVLSSDDHATYVSALNAVGADWAAREVRRLTAISDTEHTVRELQALWNEVEKRHAELWDAAVAYAVRELPVRPWEG